MLETPETREKKLSTATRMDAFKSIMRINRPLFRMNYLWVREYINLTIILKNREGDTNAQGDSKYS